MASGVGQEAQAAGGGRRGEVAQTSSGGARRRAARCKRPRRARGAAGRMRTQRSTSCDHVSDRGRRGWPWVSPKPQINARGQCPLQVAPLRPLPHTLASSFLIEGLMWPAARVATMRLLPACAAGRHRTAALLAIMVNEGVIGRGDGAGGQGGRSAVVDGAWRKRSFGEAAAARWAGVDEAATKSGGQTRLTLPTPAQPPAQPQLLHHCLVLAWCLRI